MMTPAQASAGDVSSALVDPLSSWKLLGLPLAFFYGLAFCAAVYVVWAQTDGDEQGFGHS